VRGCLGVLLLALVLVVVGLWFAAPPVAEGLVRTSLGGAGLSSDDLAVEVEADPPLKLALGRADRVLVDGTDVEWRGHHADTFHMALDDVDLLGRTASRTTGRLTGVELPGVEPGGSKADIDIAGRGATAAVSLRIDRATAEAIAAAAFAKKTGTRPGSTTLRAPNIVAFKAGPLDVQGAISVGPDGSLGVSTPSGRVVVLEPEATQPIELTSVAVRDDDLVLTGTVDVARLIR
jgi:hypothetical protein